MKKYDQDKLVMDRLTIVVVSFLICVTTCIGFYFHHHTVIEKKTIEQKIIQQDRAKKLKIWERPVPKSSK